MKHLLIQPGKLFTRLNTWFGFWVLGLIMVNIPLLYHYLGIKTTIAYLVGYLILVYALWFTSLNFVKGYRFLIIIVFASVAVQIATLTIISPYYELTIDRNEAITYWINAFLSGEYPYAVRTNLGNPISVFPFIHILAFPFTLLGNVGFLETFGYLLLVFSLLLFYKNDVDSRIFTIILLSVSPLLFFEVIGKSDIIVNMSLYAAFIMLLIYMEEHDRGWSVLGGIILGIFLGANLATRIAFWPLFAVPVIYLWKVMDRRIWFSTHVIALTVFAFLVLPFAIWNPHIFFRFAPIGVNSSKLGQSHFSQFFWLLMALGSVLCAGIFARRARDLFVLTLPLVIVIVFSTGVTFFFDLSYLQMIFIVLLFSRQLPQVLQPRGHHRG